MSSDRFVFYNPHPDGKFVGDCVKRAFTKATERDYHDVQIELNRIKREMHAKKFNDDSVWREFLSRNGFVMKSFPAVPGQKRMTVEKLASISKCDDVWVCRCAGHLVCVANGRYYDTWDSGDKCVYTAFKKLANT